MNLLEERGLFWWNGEPLADRQFAPDTAVTAHLIIDEHGLARLELDGVLLIGDKTSFPPFVGEDPAILGKSIRGILKRSNQCVLLCDLRRSGGSLSSAGVSYERYLAQTCIIGETDVPERAAEPHVSGLVVNLKGFEEWLGLRSIEIDRQLDSLTAKYGKNKDLDYLLDSGKLSLEYNIDGPVDGKQKDHKLKLSEVVLLYYIFSGEITLQEAAAQYRLLEDFMILVTDSEYSLDWPRIISNVNDQMYKFYFWRDRNSAQAPGLFECWPNLALVRDSLGCAFTIWKKKRDIFGPAFYLYLGTRRGQPAYTENRFANLIWGIESFHRTKHPELGASTKIRAKIERLLEAAPPKDRKWLAYQLRNAAEPSLEQRIFETIKLLPLGLEEGRCRQFAKSCADRRNDLSHYGGQRTGRKYNEFVLDLDNKSHALACLSHAMILQELHFEDSIVKGYVFESSKSHRRKFALVLVGLLDKEVLTPTIKARELRDQP